ncbi:hypothetical protein ADL12_13520 [Streptomyces regalis]|uniref:Uncharacterized protein n=2 Tax=Streptomyces regalis TaxID=68262 RepID=A0A0X3V7P8_9ACTN|nr:hypothetical protein ADL12_13520 [Streptomyces regalis]
MTSRTANYFVGILLGIAIVAPWLLFVASIMSGKLVWLTALDLIGTRVWVSWSCCAGAATTIAP